MRIEIGVLGAEVDDALVRALQDWIDNERIVDLSVEPKSEPPPPGRLGVDPVTVLSVVLGAPAVVALVRCLHAWVLQRRPKARIELISGKVGVVIETENIPSPEFLVDYVAPLLKAAGSHNDLDRS